MFRIYDLENKEWVKNNNVFISKDDSLIEFKRYRKRVLNGKGNVNRYVCHKHIECFDCNNRHIFEGDILEANDSNIIGVVVYVEEVASYMLLDYSNKTCYNLGRDICKELKIIGNVFDNEDLIDNELVKNDFKFI